MSPGLSTAVPLLILLGFPTARPALATQVEQATFVATVRGAGAIVIGRAVYARSRWGDPTRRWMVTEYTFQVEDAVLPGAAVTTGRTITLTFWGGSIGGETHQIAGLNPPTLGRRYVLMLRPGWWAPGLWPTLGLDQGLFPITTHAATGQPIVTDSGGSPLLLAPNGQIMRAAEMQGSAPAALIVTPSLLVRWLIANQGRLKSAPPDTTRPAPPDDHRVVPTLSARPEAHGTWAHLPLGSARRIESPLSFDLLDLLFPPIPAGVPTPGQDASPARQDQTPRGFTDPRLQYSTFGYCNLPIVVNQFPSSFEPWSPEDQYQMSKWNYYSDIFRVYAAPTGTYGWPNERFDLSGWPTSADLQRVYGSPWDPGVLAVTFYAQDAGGRILEADIALNPAYSWTLDDEWVFAGSSAQSFRQTMLHELGHMWGLNHQFGFLSVMNYSPAPYRAYGLPFMDDAEGIRARYPSQAQSRNDLGIYLFRSVGYQSWEDATFAASVVAGNSVMVNNYHLENVGTTTISTPTVEWYLTTALNYTHGYYNLGSTAYPSLPRFTYFRPEAVGRTLLVPTVVPGGDYSLGAFIRDDDGAGQASFPFSNNFGWSRARIIVYPRLTGVTVTPSSVVGGIGATGTVSLGSPAGPGGLVVSLASSSRKVSVPGAVYVPSGSAVATFQTQTRRVKRNTYATIIASSNGITSSTVLQVLKRSRR